MTGEEKAKLDIVADKVIEIYTVLLGVKGTEDDGLCGDIADLKRFIKTVNDRSKSNTLKIAGLYAIDVIIISVLLHLLGVY